MVFIMKEDLQWAGELKVKEQLEKVNEKTEQDTPRLPEQTERMKSQDQSGTQEVS